MAGDPEWDRLAEAFDQLVQLPIASRPAALDRLATGDPAFRARLEAMLAADAATAHPLDRDLGETAGDLLGRTPEAPRQIAEDGWTKVRAGITTVGAVLRVVDA